MKQFGKIVFCLFAIFLLQNNQDIGINSLNERFYENMNLYNYQFTLFATAALSLLIFLNILELWKMNIKLWKILSVVLENLFLIIIFIYTWNLINNIDFIYQNGRFFLHASITIAVILCVFVFSHIGKYSEPNRGAIKSWTKVSASLLATDLALIGWYITRIIQLHTHHYQYNCYKCYPDRESIHSPSVVGPSVLAFLLWLIIVFYIWGLTKPLLTKFFDALESKGRDEH